MMAPPTLRTSDDAGMADARFFLWIESCTTFNTLGPRDYSIMRFLGGARFPPSAMRCNRELNSGLWSLTSQTL